MSDNGYFLFASRRDRSLFPTVSKKTTDTGFLYEMIEENRAKKRLCSLRNQCFLKMRFSSLKSAIAMPFVSCLVRASRNPSQRSCRRCSSKKPPHEQALRCSKVASTRR